MKNLKDTKFKSKDIKPTRLYPININVDKINNREFQKLLKKNGNITVEYKAFSNKAEKTDVYDITLTVGAQIMVIRNISITSKSNKILDFDILSIKNFMEFESIISSLI